MPPKENHSSPEALYFAQKSMHLLRGPPWVRAEAACSSEPPLLALSGLGPLLVTAQAQLDEQSTGSLSRTWLGTESKSPPWAPCWQGEDTLLELDMYLNKESDLAAH